MKISVNECSLTKMASKKEFQKVSYQRVRKEFQKVSYLRVGKEFQKVSYQRVGMATLCVLGMLVTLLQHAEGMKDAYGNDVKQDDGNWNQKHSVALNSQRYWACVDNGECHKYPDEIQAKLHTLHQEGFIGHALPPVVHQASGKTFHIWSLAVLPKHFQDEVRRRVKEDGFELYQTTVGNELDSIRPVVLRKCTEKQTKGRYCCNVGGKWVAYDDDNQGEIMGFAKSDAQCITIKVKGHDFQIVRSATDEFGRTEMFNIQTEFFQWSNRSTEARPIKFREEDVATEMWNNTGRGEWQYYQHGKWKIMDPAYIQRFFSNDTKTELKLPIYKGNGVVLHRTTTKVLETIPNFVGENDNGKRIRFYVEIEDGSKCPLVPPSEFVQQMCRHWYLSPEEEHKGHAFLSRGSQWKW